MKMFRSLRTIKNRTRGAEEVQDDKKVGANH